MPVRILPAPHGANVFTPGHLGFANDAGDLLAKACPTEHKQIRDNHILQSSFGIISPESNIHHNTHSFVRGAVTAYNEHLHLEIRPDDVWVSILSQLNIYINLHAEELRDMFVVHQGQKNLDIACDAPDADLAGDGQGRTRFKVDWGKFAYKMTELIAENVKDPTLRDWILPSFTTTTEVDQAVASIMMMSTLQKYFTYSASITCGIPSVTLLGEKADWDQLALKAERLVTFGEEPKQWYGLLKPVLARFVQSFDSPNSEETKDFWQKIAHYTGGGSGPTYLSGWITAFCFWDGRGRSCYEPGKNPSSEEVTRHHFGSTPVLQLDDARYHRINRGDVPPGWASVPVTLNDHGHITRCALVAGLVAMKISSSGLGLHGKSGETGLDTISPMSGWWMYETKTEDELKAEKEALKKEGWWTYETKTEDELKAEKAALKKEWEAKYGTSLYGFAYGD